LASSTKSPQFERESNPLGAAASVQSAAADRVTSGPEATAASFARNPANSLPRLEAYRFHSAILPDPDHRALLVYLPRAYSDQPDQRFPVLYLHDGQNLFEGRTAFIPGHPWHAHTTADRLADAGVIEPVILVGIANTGLRRVAEYTHAPDSKHGGGEGQSYGRLLIEEVKPFLDRAYRTRPEAEYTGLGGSSLGGLISLYLGLQHPEVFTRLAVMSPSLWWDQRSILAQVEAVAPKPLPRIWLDMGTEEGLRHLRDADLLRDTLTKCGWREGVDLCYRRVAGAGHSEDDWGERFDEVLRFLYPRNPNLGRMTDWDCEKA
jgi:predicted alpha/beta superfamily hydrolase